MIKNPNPLPSPLCDIVEPDLEAKLQIYANLLERWQNKINLIGESTLEDVWNRHFLDSAQLASFLPRETKTLMDLGSGAGFPGLVLALMRPDIEVHLIESNQKKSTFLRTVSRETQTSVHIHSTRIETILADFEEDVDIVTARALAPLLELLDYMAPLLERNSDLIGLFPKGAHFRQEIDKAQEKYTFDLAVEPSQTESQAQILILTKIQDKAKIGGY